jgi:hypothetical protein
MLICIKEDSRCSINCIDTWGLVAMLIARAISDCFCWSDIGSPLMWGLRMHLCMQISTGTKISRGSLLWCRHQSSNPDFLNARACIAWSHVRASSRGSALTAPSKVKWIFSHGAPNSRTVRVHRGSDFRTSPPRSRGIVRSWFYPTTLAGGGSGDIGRSNHLWDARWVHEGYSPARRPWWEV